MMDPQQMAQPYGGTMGGGVPIPTNPLAQQIQSQGRGEDSMLVHMTPDEVNSLQGLAMAHGGSLTINPETGLPEAGWLGKLLPTILGAALAATGVGAPLAAGIVGLGQTAITGSLKKGLMAGLGAFGGAGMAGMAGLGGSLSQTGFGTLSNNAGMFGANMGQGISQGANAASSLAKLGTAPVENAINVTGSVPTTGAQAALSPAQAALGSAPTALNPVQMQTLTGGAIGSGTQAALTGVAPTAASGAGAQFTGGLGSRFGQAVRAGLPAGTPGIISKAAPMLAASGVMSGVSGAMTPKQGSMGDDGVIDNSYGGPYTAQKRNATFADNTGDILSSSKERRYFDIDMPEVYNNSGQIVQPGSSTARGTPIMQNVLNPKAKKGQNRYNQILTPYMGEGYAKGGELHLKPGGFVIDARTVAEKGGGWSPAGQAEFKKIGGVPIVGPGDGVSDSIKARIGDQPARVAAGEVYMPPEAVKRAGGPGKLYAMMNEAHKATKRGQPSRLRSGLA